MNLANTIKAMREAKEDFEPHMMYDPETGKGYKAEKPEDHERMKKLGYTHEKPEEDESEDETDLDEAFEALLDEEVRFKAGDMPNSELRTAIEKLKATKAKAESERKKFTDPTLIQSVDQLITAIDKGISTGEKAESQSSKFIAKAASEMNKAFALVKRKQHLLNSFEAEGDQLDESIDDTLKKIRKLGGSVYGDKLTSKKDKTPARLAAQTRGKKTVYFVVTDDGYKEYKDLGAVKKDWTIAGNVVDTKIAFELVNRQGDGDASDIIDTILNKYKINIAKLNKIANVALGAKSADDFLNESVDLDEAYQQFTDKTANWGEGQAVAFGRKKGYKEVAVMSDNNSKHPMVLFALDSGDKKYIKGSNVKSGETVFRYATKISIAGDIFPLVKVNIAKGIFYNLTQESSEGTIEDAKFENKGVKLKFFRSLEGAIKESVELDEAKFGDNDLVHIAKANVRGNNNPKTDKIIGYSKAPKNPNKFPDPKSGANAIMRIADAKKKGFKVESAELNEDYFMVQYYDKKGKADTTKFSKFDNEQKAKKYLDRANKAEKEGEYKMFKVKGRMEGLEEATAAKKVYTKKVGQSTVNVYQYPDKKMIAMFTSKGFGETSYGIKKLDKKAIDGAVKHFDDNKGLLGGSLDTISESANPNFFGTQANYGSSDSLLAAVNAVVTGQAETVEASIESQNEIIENGSDELAESVDLDEAFASFSVPIPAQTLSGKKIGGGKTPIVVKARTAREAIQKAAKQLGVDFKFLKTGKVMKEDNTNDDSDDGEGLDKVQPKAVKKKFKDRKDQDIDNDGDVDDSDKFLHKKRKAISKAISKDESKEKDDKKKDKKADVVDTSPSLDEGLKNPYKGKSSADLKRKLSSFESQLQDLIKKSKGRQRKEIEGEIRDMETKVQQVRSALKESCGLNEATFKSKYGSRWEAVMEATINRLAEQQELDEKFTLLKDKDIAPLVLALKDNISVELKDPKNNNLLVTMQTTDDGVQVKYKTGRNTKVGTERSPMPAIKSAVKFLKAKELAFREL